MIDMALLPTLETMLAVARTGSVGAAARQRHITSSAVSQYSFADLKTLLAKATPARSCD